MPPALRGSRFFFSCPFAFFAAIASHSIFLSRIFLSSLKSPETLFRLDRAQHPSAATLDALSSDLPLADATREFQLEYIQRSIERSRGNMTAAAEQLGLQRSNLYRKMRQLVWRRKIEPAAVRGHPAQKTRTSPF